MRKTTILLMASFPLLIMWRILEPFLPSGKHDLFLFYDHEQGLNWYVYYTSVYLSLIIYTYVIYDLCKKVYPRLKTLCLSLLLLSSARLIIYWLFRGSIAFDLLVGAGMFYSIIIAVRWRK